MHPTPRLVSLAAIVAVLGVAACTPDKDPMTGPGNGANDPVFANVSASLQAACATCHGAGSGRSYLVTMDSVTLVASGFLNPANPATSLLLTKARGVSHGGGNVTAFTSRDSAITAEWIAGLVSIVPTSEVSVAVAYDAAAVAFRFTWRSRPKEAPGSGFANFGQRYPMVFHDLLRHNGTAFARFASGARLQEDRVSMMIQPVGGPATGFGTAGCYTSCHSGMASHRILNPGVLDHWHWRSARSGPMGYAEDAALNQVERIRDAGNVAAASKWTRSGGDRLREDQLVLAGTGHASAEGMPRFVFNRGKAMPGGFVVPRYFLWTVGGATMTNPYTEVQAFVDPSVNRSLIVAYQDLAFDATDKVNGLDVGYLVWVANGAIAHLPAHLQSLGAADHIAWRDYWAAQSGVPHTDAAAADAKIAEIVAEWNASTQLALVPRSIGFIYNSDQHDVSSSASWDPVTNEWQVVLYRQLYANSVNDVNLAALPSGFTYEIGFAVHDVGDGSATHQISLPYRVGTTAEADLHATQVSNVRAVNWGAVTPLRTNFIRDDYKETLDWLLSSAHQGAAGVNGTRCQSCHVAGGSARILNP